jgi:4a-hydroxytetrahydrobiopterin dehydratase
MTLSPSQFHEAQGAEDWRVVGDGACAFFRTGSFAASAKLLNAIGELEAVDEHPPDVDVRPDGVTVRLLTANDEWYGLSERDLELARRISSVARELGLLADPSAVQSVLFIVEGMPGPAVMPFWQAVLGYERRADSPEEDLVDPRGRGPALWFETLEAPNPRGSRIHAAVWVPPDQAETRVAATLAAGGRLVRDKFAPAWWTLADAEGHEADVSTVLNRD